MSAQEDAEPELDRAEVLGVLVPACIARVYAEAPTFSSFANAFTIGKSPLRQACHDFQQLAEAGAEAGAMSAELVEIATRAFRLACDNKTSKLCDPALEGLRLLFATGLVAGATEGWAPRSRDDAYGQNGQNDDDLASALAELEAARQEAAKLADARAESAALREELAVTQRARDAALADASSTGGEVTLTIGHGKKDEDGEMDIEGAIMTGGDQNFRPLLGRVKALSWAPARENKHFQTVAGQLDKMSVYLQRRPLLRLGLLLYIILVHLMWLL